MLYTVVYEDTIVAYWDKLFDIKEKLEFCIYLNGKSIEKTQKTHYEYRDLQSETEYTIKVVANGVESDFTEIVGEKVIKTPKKRNRIDVTKAPYFAVGDGKTLNTRAIQRAFDDCKAGETVYFPKGVYLSGTLTMYTGTELYLDKGAVLQGTTEIEDYLPKVKTRFEGIDRMCYSALLKVGEMNAYGDCTTTDIVIRGGGQIVGGGVALYKAVVKRELELQKDELDENVNFQMVMETNFACITRPRPCLIEINNTENIYISDVEMNYGPSWNLHITYSKNIVIQGCAFRSFGVWNGDGFDPDSCENCDLFGCEFETGDDAIAVKSGKNPEGDVINRPCKNLKIFDIHGRNGISLGSEMSGGIENVWIWDCKFENSCNCIATKVTAKRGGYVRNVYVYDVEGPIITLRNVTFNNDGDGAPIPPVVENFYIENVILTGVKGLYNEVGEEIAPVLILGGDEKCTFKNITLKNIGIKRLPDGGYQQIQIRNLSGITLENIYNAE